MSVDLLTPVGRIVQGDVLKPRTTNSEGKPIVIKTGASAGQPGQQFFIAVAFQKSNPALRNFWEDQKYAEVFTPIYQEAMREHSSWFNQQTGLCTHPQFSWKILDGDGVDANGKPNAEKEGFPGHWVIRFSTMQAPKVVVNAALTTDVAAIKRGDYVRVAFNAKGNKSMGAGAKPGMYLNQAAVELFQAGAQILGGGIDALGVFGSAPAGQLPANAVLDPNPVAAFGAAPMMPGMPQQPAMPGMPAAPTMPQQPAMPGMPAAPMMPQQPAMPGMPGMPQQPAMPAAPMMPQQPAMPAAPMMPQQPAMPAMPGMPQQPAMPGMPGMPQQPAMPGMPQQPAAPNHAFVQNAIQQPAAPVYVALPAAGGYTFEQWIAAGQTPEGLVAAGMFARQQ